MREIKFRGKYKYNPTGWIYGNGVITVVGPFGEPTSRRVIVGWADLDMREDGNDAFGCDEVIPETIGQYTGFKDGNGVEIYEGDLVVATNDPEYKGEVYWNEVFGRYDIYWKYGDDCVIRGNARYMEWMNYNNSKMLSVVGNIHDEVKDYD